MLIALTYGLLIWAILGFLIITPLEGMLPQGQRSSFSEAMGHVGAWPLVLLVMLILLIAHMGEN